MTCAGSLRPWLQTAAPVLTRRFFEPIQHQPRLSAVRKTSNLSSRIVVRAKKQTPFLKAFHHRSTATSLPVGQLAANAASSTNLSALSRVRNALRMAWNPFPHIGEKSAAEEGKFFPQFTRRIVAYWLFGSAASVFGIIVFGGLTRLTESGYAE